MYDLVINNSFNVAFSTYLKQKRKLAGLSQEKLAERISARGYTVTAGAISNIERAYYRKADGSESQPTKQFVILAAEVLGADINEALTQADYAVDKSLQKPKNLSDLMHVLETLGIIDGIQFFDEDALRSASPDELQEVLDAVKLAVEITRQRQERNNARSNPSDLSRSDRNG